MNYNYRVVTATTNPLGSFQGPESVQNDVELLLGEITENEGEIISFDQVLTEPHVLLTTIVYKAKPE